MGFGDLLDLVFKYGLPTVLSLFLFWGLLIKDPPLWVSFREYMEQVKRAERAEQKVEELSDIVLQLNEQGREVTNVASRAVDLAKQQQSESGSDRRGTGGTSRRVPR